MTAAAAPPVASPAAPPAFLNALRRAADAVAALMFAAVFLVFLYKIALRYLTNESIAWADELSVILFIWIVFWANALVLRERDHIRFDLVYILLPPPGRRLFALLRAALLAAIFAWAFFPTLGYIEFLWRERTTVLRWPLDRVYLCFPLFLAATALRATASLILLLTPRWRTQL